MLHPQWRLHGALCHVFDSGGKGDSIMDMVRRAGVLELPFLDPPTFVTSGGSIGGGHLLGGNSWESPDVGYPVRGASEELQALLDSSGVDELDGFILFTRFSLATSMATGSNKRFVVGVLERFEQGHLIGFAPITLFRSTAHATDEQPWHARFRFPEPDETPTVSVEASPTL